MSPVNDNPNNTCECRLSLAIASVPKQPWCKPMDLALSLKRGTIFENLFMPFYIGGENHA